MEMEGGHICQTIDQLVEFSHQHGGWDIWHGCINTPRAGDG